MYYYFLFAIYLQLFFIECMVRQNKSLKRMKIIHNLINSMSFLFIKCLSSSICTSVAKVKDLSPVKRQLQLWLEIVTRMAHFQYRFSLDLGLVFLSEVSLWFWSSRFWEAMDTVSFFILWRWGNAGQDGIALAIPLGASLLGKPLRIPEAVRPKKLASETEAAIGLAAP